MARKNRKQKTTRRRKKKPINILKTAEGLVVANASTRMVFGTNLDHFLFDGWLPFGKYAKGTVSGLSYGSGSSYAFSAKELIQGTLGVGDGFRIASNASYPNDFSGVLTAIQGNITKNAAKEIPIVVLTPLAFRLGKKLLKTPIKFTNEGLKMLGLGKDVKV